MPIEDKLLFIYMTVLGWTFHPGSPIKHYTAEMCMAEAIKYLRVYEEVTEEVSPCHIGKQQPQP